MPQDKARDPSAAGPTAFISFLGFQPAAVAVPLLAWAKAEGAPHSVAVFTTEAARDVADRLSPSLQAMLPATKVVTPTLPRGSDWTSDVVLPWLRDNAPNQRVVFAIEAGIKYAVIALARILRDAVIVATDGPELLIADLGRQSYRRVPSIDLGLQNLLDIHGLTGRTVLHGVTETAIDRLELVFPHGRSLDLLQPSERNGRLYALFRPRTHLVKEDLRRLERLRSNREVLAGLRPEIAVVTDNELARRRASSGGYAVVHERAHSRWTPAQPIRTAAFGKAPISLPLGGANAAPHRSGQLMVWLGLDPSATLAAIYSHQPSVALILVDRTSSRALEIAHSLQAQRRRLPVDTLVFQPSDRFGSLDTRALQQDYPSIDFNLTPGTKMQSYVVAANTSAALWSLDKGFIRPFDAAAQPKPMTPVPVPVLALVAGPPGTVCPEPPAWTEGQRATLVAAGTIVAARLLEERRARLPELVPGEYGRLRVVRIPGTATAVRLDIDGHESVKTALRVAGDWLEDVVAASLLVAGADEVIRGIEFPYPENSEGKPQSARDELDVVARVGHHYFLLDCKSGDTLRSEHKATTEALAARLGRFTVPIAVRPAGAEEVSRLGASVLTLASITDTASLRERLLLVARQRSTTDVS